MIRRLPSFRHLRIDSSISELSVPCRLSCRCRFCRLLALIIFCIIKFRLKTKSLKRSMTLFRLEPQEQLCFIGITTLPLKLSLFSVFLNAYHREPVFKLAYFIVLGLDGCLAVFIGKALFSVFANKIWLCLRPCAVLVKSAKNRQTK